jgi:hypothetical protein
MGCGGSGAGQSGGDNESFRIQLSHMVATDTPKGLAAERFKEIA